MNIKKPFVSVVLPCFNGEKTLYDTLNSVANQSFQSIEIIFVNDGSTDRSLNIATEFKKKSNKIKKNY